MASAGTDGRDRDPAVAGTFYPADPVELSSSVRRYLSAAAAEGAGRGARVPKALIAPHAGYVYSGAVAAWAYSELDPARNRIRRVVLLGPAHRVAVNGLAVSGAPAFRTPLGRVPVDREAVARIAALPQVQRLEAAHAAEHSLEVQLPFLQCVLEDFSVVPLAVGDASAEEVDEVLEMLWGGPETLIVVSSDLSHYYDYATACRLDAETTRAIEDLAPQRLGPESACGRVPARGLLLAAKRHGLRARTVRLRNSGDTAGTRDQVVGYGSYVFS